MAEKRVTKKHKKHNRKKSIIMGIAEINRRFGPNPDNKIPSGTICFPSSNTLIT